MNLLSLLIKASLLMLGLLNVVLGFGSLAIAVILNGYFKGRRCFGGFRLAIGLVAVMRGQGRMTGKRESTGFVEVVRLVPRSREVLERCPRLFTRCIIWFVAGSWLEMSISTGSVVEDLWFFFIVVPSMFFSSFSYLQLYIWDS